MTTRSPDTGRELRTLVTAQGTVKLSLEEVSVPEPAPDEVIVRVEAAPINPSDLGLLFAGADMATAALSGPPGHPVLTAALSPASMRLLAPRVGKSLPAGNEGAGTVIATGSSEAARALQGRAVALAPGGMYTAYRRARAGQCLPPGLLSAPAPCFPGPGPRSWLRHLAFPRRLALPGVR
jgi:NADPH2:quinone reductase